ncbi:sensor histidine kinase [candidate division KSB1 bacterium]|nr:sensor histidine kinase [candidate division KSB1 bacterium]
MKPSNIAVKHRLLTRLLISHILLASLPIVVSGILLVHTAQKSIESIIKHRNLEFVKKAAQSITETLEQSHKVLLFNAENVVNLLDNRLIREIAISNLVDEFPIYQKMYILRPDGSIEFSSHYVEDNNRFVGQPFIKKLPKGKGYVSDVYLSSEMVPCIDMAEPIRKYDEITGYLYAEVSLKAMWDVMDSLVVGEHGAGLMIDSKGNYIAHSKRKLVYLNEKFPDQEIIKEITNEHMGHKIYIAENNTKMIASYAPIPMKKWGVIIQQPINEAFAQARIMRVQVLILVITSIIVAWLIAYYFFSERIVQPVNQLLSGIERFASGELRYRIPELGDDEISTLATQFNRMAMRLSKIQKKLKRTERSETLNKMASILSHEIKNPLNAMVINLQILKKELVKIRPNKKRMLDYYHIVESEIHRVDKLVNDFLILARPPKLEEQSLIIQDIIEEIIIDQSGDRQHRNIKLINDIPSEPIRVIGNHDRLKQAFLNIYLNAVQAINNDGAISVKIELGADESQSENPLVNIGISDTGIGIDERQLKHIFDFYYTTKESGSGLGLAIALQIIEEHDGWIHVKSKSGEGSTFIITLPVE